MFDTKIVNTGRQLELDVTRAISCILMVTCHVGLYTGFGGSDGMHLFSELLGAEFAAPVFMALMGIGICYSRHSAPGTIALRGLKLIALGYLLGFIRQGIPILIFGEMDPFFLWPKVFEVDILQFAGLALVFVALVKKLNVPSIVVLMLSVILVGIGESLTGVGTGNVIADHVLDLLWGADEGASFPFLHWFFFVAFGMFFGEILQHCNNKGKLYRMLLPVSGAGVLLTYVLVGIYGVAYYNNSNYYCMGVKNAVFALYYVVFLISVSWYIARHLKDRAMKVCSNLSRGLNSIYCISSVIIFALAALQMQFNCRFNDITVYVLMIVITMISYYAALWYLNVKKKFINCRKHSGKC